MHWFRGAWCLRPQHFKQAASVKIVSIKLEPRRKPHQLATATLMLSDDTHTLTIRDIRVLKGERGPWIGEPEHTMPASGPAKYEYRATVEFSPSLKREISDAVISLYRQKAHADSDQHGPKRKLNV